jgi:hypothetical protein
VIGTLALTHSNPRPADIMITTAICRSMSFAAALVGGQAAARERGCSLRRGRGDCTHSGANPLPLAEGAHPAARLCAFPHQRAHEAAFTKVPSFWRGEEASLARAKRLVATLLQ